MAASAKSVRAGKAYVELGADGSQMERGLRAAEAKLKSWGNSIAAVGAKIAAVGIGALAGSFAAVMGFADLGSQLDDISQRLGITVESVSALGYAAQQSGTNIEALEGGLIKMARTISDAAGGSREATDALAELGVTVADLANLAPDEQFARLADGIAAIENPTARTAAAMKVFGRGAAPLIPLLAGGAAGLEEFKRQAEAAGVVMSGADARAANDFGDQVDGLKTQFRFLVAQIGAAVLPVFRDLVTAIQSVVGRTIGFIRENRALILGMLGGAIAVAGLGVALVVLGKVIAVVGAAIGAVASVLAVVFSPAGLIIAGVAAALALAGGLIYLLFQIDAVREGFAAIIPDLGEFGATFQRVWGGINAALSAGDLGAAAEIGWLGIQVVWQQGLNWLMDWVRRFKNDFLNVWDSIITEIAVGISNGLGLAAQAFNTFLSNLPRGVRAAMEGIGIGPVQFNAAGNEAVLRGDLARVRADRARAAGEGRNADAAALARAQADLEDAVAAAEIMAGIAEADRLRGIRPGALAGLEAGAGATSRGTFSAAQLSAFGGGLSPADRAARAAEQSLMVLQQVRDLMRNAVLVFQ